MGEVQWPYFWRRKPMTWREELVYEEKQRQIADKKAKQKAAKEAKKKAKEDAKKSKVKVVAPKIGRNGLTWAEKEATKKNMDSVSLVILYDLIFDHLMQWLTS